MNNKMFSFLSLKEFPERTLYQYLLLLFVISNFISLLASILFVAFRFSLGANQFLGFSQGLGIACGLGLLIILVRIRLVIKNLFSAISEERPEYASVFLKFNETLINVGISIVTAGLILNLFLPFGFLVVLAGIVIGFHSLIAALKEHEENEAKILEMIRKERKTTSFFGNIVADSNVFILMFLTLCGYLLVHPEYFESIRNYFEDRSKLCLEVKK